MPPKARFRNKKKNKNNNSPYHSQAQNQGQNTGTNYNNDKHQNKHTRGRSTSRTRSNRPHSRKPYQRPNTPNTPRPSTPKSSPIGSTSLASKATQTLRSSLFSSPTGILKRRISLGLSVTLPSSAPSARLKALLLQAIDDARGCVGKMDWENTHPENNCSVEVPVTTTWNAGGWDETRTSGFGDSGIAMDTDVEDDPWEMETTPVAVDHGCVDIVREHGRLVQRMRWTTDSADNFELEPPWAPSKRGQGTGKGRNGRVRQGRNSFGGNDDESVAVGRDDEVM